MILTELEQQIVDFLKNDKVLSKHTCKSGYVSGCTTYVAPISVWTHTIEVLIENSRKVTPYILRGVCKRIKDRFKGQINGVYVSDFDGSCPRHLVVHVYR